jgi:predicted TIM-barrel enzyme
MDRKILRIGMLAATVAMSVPVLILVTDFANAQSSGRGGADVRAIKGGYCPVGTCGRSGGRRAMNLANCAASNCRH